MSIVVNGKTVPYVHDETVSDLLKRIKYTFPLIIVKINGTLIRKKEYDHTFIPDRATIDVVHMISGG
ncbi:MAG: sulfur carrier protein ThiS [Candidatus Heimdallarchaeota archaeon]|nr:sulfur carrier protein ThiS [Candidatus Heimdallarchaeota archaeon]